MAHNQQPGPRVLRDEARLLMLAGLSLLAIAVPATLALAMMALSPDGLNPTTPIVFGGAPVLMGYAACHFASSRLAQAKQIARKTSALA